MPRKLRYTTEQARNLLNKYGYMPHNGFEFRGINRTYNVLDEVQNRNVRISFNTFLRKIKQNKLSEVDPFLHTLQAIPGEEQPVRTNNRLSNYVNNFPAKAPKDNKFEQFRKESREVQELTYRKSIDFKQKCLPNIHRNVSVDREYDDVQDKSSLYAIIDTLYAIADRQYKQYRVVLEVDYNVLGDDEPVPEYYTINEETVAKLKALIKEVWFGEKKLQYDESDKYMLPALSDWAKIKIIFDKITNPKEKLNRLDEPGTRRAGAKWAWINNTSIDLSRYGIFNKFDLNNYRYPCFIWALEQSKMLSDSEVEFIKQIVNTRYFPMDNLKKICKKLNIVIEVRTLDTKNKTHITVFGQKDKCMRTIKLLLREQHYMLDEDVPLSSYYIKNYKFVDENINPNSKVIDKKTLVSRLYPDGNVKDTVKKGMNINKVIDLFFECKYFTALTANQLYQSVQSTM